MKASGKRLYLLRVARRIAPSPAPTARSVLTKDGEGVFGIVTCVETMRPVLAVADLLPVERILAIVGSLSWLLPK
ncbi:hypothetical protein IN07_11465 [Modestobacter caceresii]|uniref:Uncharacterized protein n=1 Tax=Modestobacter caceresii TaxID=1522368 RepID=A0A098Y838_9ACTN|nr:hypothetical protein IN07_11465 [Modestobacter caceresii]